MSDGAMDIEAALRASQIERQARADYIEAGHRKLHHDMTDEMIRALQYLDVCEIDPNPASPEMARLAEIGTQRYLNDARFHAKVTMLVSATFDVLRKNGVNV